MSAAQTESRALLTLAAPLVVAQLAQMAMGVVGTLVAGQLGVAQLAAQGLGATAFSLVLILSFGLIAGLDPHIARAVGAGQPQRAGALHQQGLWLAAMAGLPMAGLVLLAIPALRWMGQDAQLMADVATFLRWSALGLLPALGFAASRSFLSAVGQPALVMRAAVVANIVHAALCVVLALGPWGLPRLGLQGIALAGVLCRLLMLGLVQRAMRRAPELQPYRALWAWPAWPLFAQVLRSGLPLALQYALEASSFALVTFWIGLLGAATLAAHEVALNLASLAFQVPFALSTAAAMRVGHAVGRNDAAGIARAGWTALRLGLAFAVVSASLMLLLRLPMARLYLPHAPDAVLGATGRFLAIAAAFQLADAAQAVGFGILRGLDDTRVPVLFNLLAFGALGLPLGWVQVHLRGQSAEWFWWGLSLGLGLVAALLALRFAWHVRRRSR